MKKKLINATHIEGLLYEHSLEKKVTGSTSKNPGTEYIGGAVKIATDNAITNVIEVHFPYVTATTAKGTQNPTYAVFSNIINGIYKTVMGSSAEEATKLRIDSTISLNEFYIEENGADKLISAKRNSGGFVHVVNALSDDESTRNTFDVDMVITNVRTVEGDEERQIPTKAIVKGAIFDFKKSLLPVEFSAIDPRAIDYFEGLEASAKNPVFTRLKGKQVSEEIVKRIEEESAFGAPSIKEVKRTYKDYVITWAQTNTYEWDSEDGILASELAEAMNNREIYLATLKQNREEWKKAKAAPVAPATAGFNF